MYVFRLQTRARMELKMRSLVLWPNLPHLQILWSLVNAALASKSCLLMFASVPPNLSTTESGYSKDSTFSTSSPSILM